MESNKDEARREKVMAEERIESNDFPGALTFAQRAQLLDPELDGISQMLSMLEVNISAQRRVGGEIDWYGVLGVDPTADQETIDNQYRKLAQALNPDTNPLRGASSALSLVSRARSLLSNRARRSTYDRIAGYRPIEGVGLPEAGESSARAGSASSAAGWMTWHDDSPYMGMWQQPPLVDECEACAEKMDDEMLLLIHRMMMEDDDEYWSSHLSKNQNVPAGGGKWRRGGGW